LFCILGPFVWSQWISEEIVYPFVGEALGGKSFAWLRDMQSYFFAWYLNHLSRTSSMGNMPVKAPHSVVILAIVKR